MYCDGDKAAVEIDKFEVNHKMRSEKEMFDLFLSFARNDERIRVVGMEGSRTNINIPKDDYQDYDISYIVTDMDSFIKTTIGLMYSGKE